MDNKTMNDDPKLWLHLLGVAAVSAVVGLLRSFHGSGRVTVALAVSRSALSAGIGIGVWSSTFVLLPVLVPDVAFPDPARVAISVFFATLGEQGLERALQLWRGQK